MFSIAHVLDVLEGLGPPTPQAAALIGVNPIDPECPVRGIFPLAQWASTTQNSVWEKLPGGWLEMEKRELAGEDISFFIISTVEGRFCLDRSDENVTWRGLYTKARPDDVREAAEYLSMG
jgi:hypothetical protein